MRSISGFNGSSTNGSFAEGQPISASALNKLATGIDMAKTGMSNDIQFQANTGNTAYGLNQQVWYGTTGDICPLQIYGLRYDTDADKYYINVSPGMVNNIAVTDHDDNLLTKIPAPNIQVFVDGITETLTDNYVYIACQNSGTPDFHYPDPEVPPYITIKTTIQADTDETSFLLIGIVQGATDFETDIDTLRTFNYKSCGSLWSTRYQCGTGNPAIYYWSAV